MSAVVVPEEYPLIAEFRAFIRRPEPLESGVRARLYGQNGADADAILRLAKTQYQDALVDVSLWQEETEIGGFQGYVRRPKPTVSGMTALFYAQNGEAADAVTAMSLSRFLDAEVRVRVRLVQNPDGAHQAKKRAPKGPYSAPAKDLWKSGFFSVQRVQDGLAEDGLIPGSEYEAWLRNQACMVPRANHGGEVGLLCGPNGLLVPVCEHHRGMQWTRAMLDQTHRALRHRWAWEIWTQQQGYTSMTQVPPEKLARWAREHDVEQYLPLVYGLPGFERMERMERSA